MRLAESSVGGRIIIAIRAREAVSMRSWAAPIIKCLRRKSRLRLKLRLRLSREHGLILNFAKPTLEIKRVIASDRSIL